jgi:class 3 adenylate cyclase/prephenate dehydratase
MENARLMNETREALEQQTATSEVLGVINSSPGDLIPVFDVMLDKAISLSDSVYGHLLTYDGEFFDRVAVRGESRMVERQSLRRRAEAGITLERIVRGESVVQITDVMDTDAYRTGNLAARVMVDEGGCRTLLTVALRKEETLLGTLSVYRRGVRPFADKEIGLLQNFAAQAVIAMENARLITETREALEQQTATAEVLGVINSSPGDLAPVFDAMLEKATTLCEAAHGALFVQEEGERFRAIPSRSTPAVFAEFLTREPVRFDLDPERSIMGRTLQRRSAVQVADLRESEPYRNKLPIAVAAVETARSRTLLSVPMFREDAPVGIFQLARQEVRPFTDKQIALASNFAAQAVIAIENTRLITETREALEQQTATAEVLQVINSSPGDLAPVFDAMLEKAMRLIGAAFGIANTYDGKQFRTAALQRVPPALAELWSSAPPEPGPNSALTRLASGEDVVHIEDYSAYRAYKADEPRAKALVEVGGVRTYLAVPLRKDGQLLGTIAAYRQEVRPFTDKQIALLQNFAAQAVIAMENARLLGKLRERNEEIAGWNRDLEERVAGQLAELERTGKLRRFLAPQLADLIIAQGDESILESHRREIVVVFCDIRGFTAFAECAEPEEVMALLRDYHAALGPIVARFEGTLDHYSGDGVMVFFNDPLPTPEPAKRAIEMAAAMREAAQQVLKTWRRHGHDLGFGVGISQGYATLGQIGFAERMDYTAIGTVCNLAARLCDEAKDGQILISRRVAVAVEEDAKLEEIGEVSLKGLSQAVAIYNVVQ